MNLTLSVDEQVVERAREAARNQGTSLNELIRKYLEDIAGITSDREAVEEWHRLVAEGRKWTAKLAATEAEPYVFNREEDAYDGKRIGNE